MLGEFVGLVILSLKTRLWEYAEEGRVRRQFYSHRSFKQVDQSLKKLYRFRSPFEISKQFLVRKGMVDVHCYGETPLSTLDTMAKKAGLSKQDRFLELGCGRGRSLFFLASMYGCRVSGVEWIPEFILKSFDIAKRYSALPISFYLADMCRFPLDGASVIYLYGTCLSDEVIVSLAERMKRLPSHVKIITVSYPLSDYQPDSFTIIDQFSASFNWGVADVFIQTPSPSAP